MDDIAEALADVEQRLNDAIENPDIDSESEEFKELLGERTELWAKQRGEETRAKERRQIEATPRQQIAALKAQHAELTAKLNEAPLDSRGFQQKQEREVLMGQHFALGAEIQEREAALPFIGISDEKLQEQAEDFDIAIEEQQNKIRALAQEFAAKHPQNPQATARERDGSARWARAQRDLERLHAQRGSVQWERQRRNDMANVARTHQAMVQKNGQQFYATETRQIQEALQTLNQLWGQSATQDRKDEITWEMEKLTKKLNDPKRLELATQKADEELRARLAKYKQQSATLKATSGSGIYPLT